MKKFISMGIALLAAVTLAACSSTSNQAVSTNTEKTTNIDTNKGSTDKASKKSANTEIPTTPDEDWFYSKAKDTFYAGNLTFAFTKTEVRNGMGGYGEKVLIVYGNVRNNSKKYQHPSDFWTYLTPRQKNDTSDDQLDTGLVEPDKNLNNPIREQQDNLDKDLLPGKTTEVAMVWTLYNDSPVTIEISNDMFNKIGEKTVNVK